MILFGKVSLPRETKKKSRKKRKSEKNGHHRKKLLEMPVINYLCLVPGCVAQSVAHLTQEPEVPGSIPGLARYSRFSFI